MTRFKQQLLLSTGLVAASGMSGTAYAADLSLKGYEGLPSWAGAYIGANIGVARFNATATQVDPSIGYYGACQSYYAGASCATSDTGLAASINAGYDFQHGHFVYGVVADWTWTDLDHTQYTQNVGDGYGGTYDAKVDWLASLRGRMGLAVDDTLVYVTGGIAAGGLRSSIGYEGATYASLDQAKIGWVGGFGVDHKFDPHWSVKGEFLYYDLGRSTAPGSYDGESYATEFTHEILVGQVGLAYHF